jgi:aspartyl/asparaginyl beta-hydroxylase (cupin superfamily)
VDPRTLFDTARGGPGHPVAGSGVSSFIERPADVAGGRQRFHRYVETLAAAEGSAGRGVYPQLNSQPWFDPSDFPLVSYLESHFEAIRDEILALESRYQRESERIKRAGDWDVVFMYERGRRRDDVCDACPVTTLGIESHSTMRTVTGLIYASRMRPGAHIQAHRGPTNLRVRCHLGIKVPGGDCAIRVGDHSQQWRDGQCLVFDDYFEHEAWNHTEEDRIVLIVDLWHPGLSATEVRLLEGLHTYTYQNARQLTRYWSSNAQAEANRPSADP